jgi:hypothetical protein
VATALRALEEVEVNVDGSCVRRRQPLDGNQDVDACTIYVARFMFLLNTHKITPSLHSPVAAN